MIEEVRYSRTFKKQYKKLPSRIQQRTKDRIKLLQEDQFNPLLNHHILSGKLKGMHSINITGDYRAIYTEIDRTIVIFEMIGTHHQLYGL